VIRFVHRGLIMCSGRLIEEPYPREAEQFLFGEAAAECPYNNVLNKSESGNCFQPISRPRSCRALPSGTAWNCSILRLCKKGVWTKSKKRASGKDTDACWPAPACPCRCEVALTGIFFRWRPVVRWLERGEWKSDCVTWSDLYLSTSRVKKFARTLHSFDDVVCADRVWFIQMDR
jgi:hypothetical protein